MANPDIDIHKLLREEGNFNPSDEVINLFIDNTEEITYPKKASIINPGSFNPYLYLTIEGTTRLTWWDGLKEFTFGFAGPGSFSISPFSYYHRRAAHFGIYACTPCTLIRMHFDRFRSLIDQSHEFARWMFDLAMFQFYAIEMKALLMQGNAKENYLTLENETSTGNFKSLGVHHPNVLRDVASKDIAAYLGITPSFLSNIRKEIHGERRSGK